MLQYKKGEIIEVEIEKMAFGGIGIGKLENKIVFVENTVPGDVVNVSLTKIKPNFFEAKLVEFIKESESRIEPRCRHFHECGGCSFQYLSYENQLTIKEQQVKEALEHIGGFKNPKIKPIIGNKKPWFYRNKMEFSFYLDDEENLLVGLHPKGYRYEVFELKECFLQTDKTAEIVHLMQEFGREHNLKPFNFKKGTGLLRSMIIRFGRRTNERMINLIVSDEEFKFKNEFKKLFEKFATSIYITQIIQKKGIKTEVKQELIFGKKVIIENMEISPSNKLKFEILPQAFFQPNTLQAEKLYSLVLEMGDIKKEDVVFDLFCGTGTIGLFIAHKAEKVYGADENIAAIENAKKNAQLNNIPNVEFIAGDAYKVVKEWGIKPDITIVDPPRSGLNKKLCDKLAKLKVRTIIYVSCNPSTQARDMKILKQGGYKLVSTQPVDMAPQTYHIETVSKLVYNKGWSLINNLIKK